MILIGNMIRAIGSQHLPGPGKLFIGIGIAGDKPTFPGTHLLEGRIQLTRQKSFFIMQVAGNLAIRCLIVRIDNSVNASLFLPLKPGLVKGGAEGQSLQDPRFAGPFTGLEDRLVDLHRFAILSTIGTSGNQDLLHQIFVGKQLVEKLFLIVSLLGKFSQSARRPMTKDRHFHQAGIQFVVCQAHLGTQEDLSGRSKGVGFGQLPGRLVCLLHLRIRIFNRSLESGQFRPRLEKGGFFFRIQVWQARRDFIAKLLECPGISGLQCPAFLSQLGCPVFLPHSHTAKGGQDGDRNDQTATFTIHFDGSSPRKSFSADRVFF